jgi:hypothetical protein
MRTSPLTVGGVPEQSCAVEFWQSRLELTSNARFLYGSPQKRKRPTRCSGSARVHRPPFSVGTRHAAGYAFTIGIVKFSPGFPAVGAAPADSGHQIGQLS